MLCHDMLCHALFCHALFCHAMFSYVSVMLCSVVLCSVQFCHARRRRGGGILVIPGGPGDLAAAVCRVGGSGGRFFKSNQPALSGGEQVSCVMSCYALLCFVILGHAILCQPLFCHAMFCYVSVMLLYVMLFSVLFCHARRRRGGGILGIPGGPGDLAAAVCRVGGSGGLFLKSNDPNLSGGEQPVLGKRSGLRGPAS